MTDFPWSPFVTQSPWQYQPLSYTTGTPQLTMGPVFFQVWGTSPKDVNEQIAVHCLQFELQMRDRAVPGGFYVTDWAPEGYIETSDGFYSRAVAIHGWHIAYRGLEGPVVLSEPAPVKTAWRPSLQDAYTRVAQYPGALEVLAYTARHALPFVTESELDDEAVFTWTRQTPKTGEVYQAVATASKRGITYQEMDRKGNTTREASRVDPLCLHGLLDAFLKND